jgi:hypothetical protein
MSLTVIRPLSRRRHRRRELLDLVAVEDPLGLLERRPDRRGDERSRSSARDRLARVVLEAEIAVGQDPDEDPAASVIGTPEMR